jgi:hypothetical protein
MREILKHPSRMPALGLSKADPKVQVQCIVQFRIQATYGFEKRSPEETGRLANEATVKERFQAEFSRRIFLKEVTIDINVMSLPVKQHQVRVVFKFLNDISQSSRTI